jgi:hypothetical protein
MKLIKAWIAAGILFVQPLAALQITSAFDGGWYDPDQNGQGFTFNVYADTDGTSRVVAYFYTYDPDGRPSFFFGTGAIIKDVASIPLYRTQIIGPAVGGVFPAPLVTRAGGMSVRFDGCNSGDVEFNVSSQLIASIPGPKIRIGTGSFRIQRTVTKAFNAERCVGGMSDDTLPSEVPAGFDRFLQTTSYRARATYERRPDRSSLALEFRGLTVGNYKLWVNGLQGPTFAVSSRGLGTTYGRVTFESPLAHLDAFLLDFPVAGSQISVSREFDVNEAPPRLRFPSTIAPLSVPGEVSFVNQTPRTIDRSYVASQVAGNPRQAAPNNGDDFVATAQLTYVEKGTQFKVTLEGAAPGLYDIFIEGKRRASVDVIERASGDLIGEAVFRSPAEAGTFPLDFNPRDQTINFVRDGNLMFSFRFQEFVP